MIQRLIASLLRFAHREGWLLKLADYLDAPAPFEHVINPDEQHPA